MAKRFGVEYPERVRMSILSDLLGMPHFPCSAGSTVQKNFLLAVAAALGVPQSEATRKDAVLAAAIEAATGQPMDPTLFSPGGTVTDLALQTIIDGIVEQRQPTPVETPPPDIPLDLAARDQAMLKAQYEQEQDALRPLVFAAYDNHCCLSEQTLAVALDVSMIIPPEEGGPRLVSNALLLRSDLHAMFEYGLLAISESLQAVLHPDAARVPTYAALAGADLRLPSREIDRPSRRALRLHREWAGL